MAPELLDRFRAELIALGCEPTPARKLGVAVSGGGDSLGLLLLAGAALPGAIAAATLDHGLRAEAAEEARAVGAVASQLSVPHAVLTGAVPPGASRQAQARGLRYRLLAEWAAREGVGWIATAHHLEDQAETFLMRAARGSGVGGLAGVRARVRIAGVEVVRPLLGWRRAVLAALVAGAGLTPVDDPANRDPTHDRTALRALLAREPRLDSGRLARSAATLAEAEEALGWVAARLAEERLEADVDGLLLRAPAALPRELRRRLVLAALVRLSDAALRGDEVETLLRRLERGDAATLAGVHVRPGADWTFALAPPRRG